VLWTLSSGIGLSPSWLNIFRWNTALALLSLALPVSVTYAIIRHRVIDVRFLLSRAVVMGSILLGIGLLVLCVEWIFSKTLPTSRFEVVVYAGIALLVGFSLNAARATIGNLIDRLFFHQWHRAQQLAGVIADSIRHATSRSDVYDALTEGIARALSLGSAALFERFEDGGYVRVAAYAWHIGTLWHVLSDDPLLLRVRTKLRPVDLDSFRWRDERLPSGAARPATFMPIAAGGQVAALLLLGAHEDGTGLAPDELRMIRRFCADAGLVFANETVPEWESIPTATPLPTV
jgi:hypothetical protein